MCSFQHAVPSSSQSDQNHHFEHKQCGPQHLIPDIHNLTKRMCSFATSTMIEVPSRLGLGRSTEQFLNCMWLRNACACDVCDKSQRPFKLHKINLVSSRMKLEIRLELREVHINSLDWSSRCVSAWELWHWCVVFCTRLVSCDLQFQKRRHFVLIQRVQWPW